MKRRSGLPNRLILVVCVLLVVLFVHPSESSESSGLRLITTASGELGADNFTYYEVRSFLEANNINKILLNLFITLNLYGLTLDQFIYLNIH